MKNFQSITASLCVTLAFCATGMAQETKPKQSVLITNANIFDGKSDKLATGMSVLVEDNKIAKIAKSIKAPDGATVIDANGCTMSPGFIATHEHIVGQMPFGDIFTTDTRYAANVPVTTHMRNWSMIDPLSCVEMVNHLIGLAATSGAKTHIFHIHSTMLMDATTGIKMLEKARATGIKISTESYPYGIGTIPLGSAILHELQEQLRKTLGIEFTDVRLTAKGRMITGEEDMRKEQALDPGQFTIFKFLDENKPAQAAVLDQTITTPWTMIGSDTVPWDYKDGTPVTGTVWTMTKEMFSHPRSAGNYSKLLRVYVRERKLLT